MVLGHGEVDEATAGSQASQQATSVLKCGPPTREEPTVPRPIRLQRQCHALLATLTVPDPFDFDAFCAMVAEHRGRPLRLMEMRDTRNGPGPSGMWIATDAEDIVLVEPRTSVLHRRHIALHEIGHMLWDHTTSGVQPADRKLFCELDSTMVRRLLTRERPTDLQEQEAEMLATVLSSRIQRSATGGRTTWDSTATDHVLGRGSHLFRCLSARLTDGGSRVADVVATGRALHRLRPLWRSLHAVEPSVALPGAGWWTLMTPGGQRLRLVRRVIEIRDIELALCAYADLDVTESRRRTLTARADRRHAAEAVDHACRLQAACRAELSGVTPTAADGWVPTPGGDDLDDEVASLLRIAAAWRACRIRQ